MVAVVPSWLKKRVSAENKTSRVSKSLAGKKINTVCQSAVCPNINECFNRGTATFMILGDVCTRSCMFCAVKKGKPELTDPAEPERIAEAVKELGLLYAVITSVTRDDLEDGGAQFFADTVEAIYSINPKIKVEVLIPDFQGNEKSIKKVVDSKPAVIGHNVEMVPSLYNRIRPQAVYERSLHVLEIIKNMDKNIYTKSGLMLGLGEKYEDVIDVMKNLRKVNCDLLTIGQYLKPDKNCVPVDRYVTPEEYKEYEKVAYKLGFHSVASGPFVRSSYNAEKLLDNQL
ncbi:MAG: lipoyl synthase [Elusimicrobia bacterium]|nr:lipoyl synthase [Elusimicrobiota bacterium]